MQLHLKLLTFEYQNNQKIRTFQIAGEPWFCGPDVCKVLDLSTPSAAYARLDKDDVSTTHIIDAIGRRQEVYIVSEFGLYDFILQSRKQEARKFKRWVTHEVLPQIRKTGMFRLNAGVVPIFVRRFNDNWNRVDAGHFSVISELFIRIYGRFEQMGCHLEDRAPDGKEIRPDVSVGRLFADWIDEQYPQYRGNFKPYLHKLPDGLEVEARQYSNRVLPAFIEFVEKVWLPRHGPKYFEKRDRKALEFLPKLLPPQPNN